MALHFILANLLANNDRAVGALFLDDTGETVEMACSEISPHEVKVAGAYLGIYLRNLGRLLEDSAMGVPRVMHIARGGIHVHVMALPEGYCLALLQRPPALVGQARKSLSAAVEQVKTELFDPADWS
jgi:hypothetical protein